MSRFFFFTQEAFRALRRNGAPSMAAIVTTVTTVILLGVLIPVFQTTQAKSNEVRDSLEFRVRDLRRRDRGRNRQPCKASWKRSRTSPRCSFITKAEALNELEEVLRQGQESKN